MSLQTDKVSVIIPVFNGARHIADTVASVWAQTFRPIEVIVVDDGSTDNTAEVVQSLEPKCVYIRQENQGPPVARNTGLKHATGDIIALLDADDLWPKNKLDLQLPILLENPDVEIVLGYTQHFRTFAATSDAPARIEYAPPFFIIQLGCALFRRNVFDKVGGFASELTYSDDHDFLLRTREHAVPTRMVHEATILYRRHPGNMTQIEGHRSASYLSLLKRSLDRRREMGIDELDMSSWTE